MPAANTIAISQRLAGAAFALGLLLVGASPADPARAASSPHGQRFGKTLLVEHRLSEDMIRRLNAFKPSAPVKGESALVNAMLADTVDWSGPDIEGRTAGNPYTIAVLVTGTARADGEVASLWQAGWKLESKFGGEEGRLVPLAGLAKSGVRTGERVELAAASMPTSFREDRKVAPTVGMVNARNLHVTEVRVQVWSGAAATGFAETILSFRWALVGLVLVALWWFGFRRR